MQKIITFESLNMQQIIKQPKKDLCDHGNLLCNEFSEKFLAKKWHCKIEKQI